MATIKASPGDEELQPQAQGAAPLIITRPVLFNLLPLSYPFGNTPVKAVVPAGAAPRDAQVRAPAVRLSKKGTESRPLIPIFMPCQTLHPAPCARLLPSWRSDPLADRCTAPRN
jgi:hypothetical protein